MKSSPTTAVPAMPSPTPPVTTVPSVGFSIEALLSVSKPYTAPSGVPMAPLGPISSLLTPRTQHQPLSAFLPTLKDSQDALQQLRSKLAGTKNTTGSIPMPTMALRSSPHPSEIIQSTGFFFDGLKASTEAFRASKLLNKKKNHSMEDADAN